MSQPETKLATSSSGKNLQFRAHQTKPSGWSTSLRSLDELAEQATIFPKQFSKWPAGVETKSNYRTTDARCRPTVLRKPTRVHTTYALAATTNRTLSSQRTDLA